MKRYHYAKIAVTSAMSLGLDKIRQKTPSGDYIINESDLITYGNPSQSFAEKVKILRGNVLSAFEAKQELQKR